MSIPTTDGSMIVGAMPRPYLLLAPLLLASGCLAQLQAKFDPYYTRTTPRYYEPTEAPLMFQYSVEDATWSVEHYFSPMTLIGHLDFNGPAPSPRDFYRYGSSLGADVIVLGATQTDAQTVEATRTVYDTATSTVYDSAGNAVGSVKTNVPREEPYTYTIYRYDFVVSFFRYKTDEVPWWGLRADMVTVVPPKKAGLDGLWSDGDYVIKLQSSKTQYLGFVENISENRLNENQIEFRKLTGKRRQLWTVGDLKFMFEKQSMSGLWLMGNKKPVPCKFKLDKASGYLKGDCADGARTLERVRD